MEFSDQIKELGDKIFELTHGENVELAMYLEQVHGIEDGIVRICNMPGEGDTKPQFNQNIFDVRLTDIPDQVNRIGVMKVIRELTGYGLKEVKDLVDKTPITIKFSIPVEDAEAMKFKLEKEGARVELK